MARTFVFLVSFCAGAALAQPVVELLSPAVGSTIAGCTTIAVNVTSPTQLRQVRATLGSLSCELALTASTWSCVLETSSLTAGSATLRVVATDASGATGEAQAPLLVEPLPTVRITEPQFAAVLRTNLEARADCQPRGALPCSVTAALWTSGRSVGSTPLEWTGSGTVVGQACVDDALAQGGGFEPGPFLLVAYTARRNGLWPLPNSAALPLFLEPNAQLTPRAEPGGLILDATADALLTLDGQARYWRIRRDGGVATHLADRRGPVAPFGTECAPGVAADDAPVGWLTPSGAVVSQRNGELELYREGNAAGVRLCDGGVELTGLVRGDWGIFCGKLVRFSTGTSVAVGRHVDLNANGDVLVLPESSASQTLPLLLWRQGSTTTVADCATGSCIVTDARFDGDRVLYVDWQYQLWESGPAGRRLLTLRFFSQYGRFQEAPTFRGTTGAAGGWTVYPERVDPGGVIQLFLGAPDGGVRQLTHWQNHSHFEAVSPTGEVTYFVDVTRPASPRDIEEPRAWRRHRVRPDGDDLAVSSSTGRARWVNGEWEVSIGNTLFTLAVDGGAAACTVGPDGGVDAANSGRKPGCGCGASPALGVALLALLARRRSRRSRRRS